MINPPFTVGVNYYIGKVVLIRRSGGVASLGNSVPWYNSPWIKTSIVAFYQFSCGTLQSERDNDP